MEKTDAYTLGVVVLAVAVIGGLGTYEDAKKRVNEAEQKWEQHLESERDLRAIRSFERAMGEQYSLDLVRCREQYGGGIMCHTEQKRLDDYREKQLQRASATPPPPPSLWQATWIYRLIGE